MTRTRSRLLGPAGVLAATLLLFGCGGGGGGSGDSDSTAGAGSGTLRVSLTDAPACGYDAVFVTVAGVRVHQSATAADGQAGWSEIAMDPPRRIDLLSLSNGVLHELGQMALPAGNYQQVRLVLADNGAVPLANAVAPNGGMQRPLDTPSGQQSGIKLQANVDVPAGQTVDLVLDFDACRSVVPRGGSGRYNLKPVIAVVPMISVGAISGYAAAAAPAPADGVKVSAQVGGAVVKETVVASGAQFRLAPIAAGTYDVVFTATGRVTRVVTGVPVSTAATTVMSAAGTPITLPASDSGTVAGKVTPAQAQASVRALQSIGATGRVEVGSVNADGLSGDYSLSLPTAAIEVAAPAWPAPPILAAPAYLFSAVAGSAGNYAIEASAIGYATSAPQAATVPAGGSVARDFTLSTAP